MKKLAVALLSLGFVGFGVSAHAGSNCTLNGEVFYELNAGQESALKSVGATCQTEKVSENYKFGDEGFAVVDGERVELIDILASPDDYYQKEVEVYGYFWREHETDPNRAWGYRFDLKLSNLSGYNWLNGDQIDIIVVPNKSEDSPKDLNKMRASAFKAFRKTNKAKSLVKFTGTIGLYSNTGGVYISSKYGPELVDKKG